MTEATSIQLPHLPLQEQVERLRSHLPDIAWSLETDTAIRLLKHAPDGPMCAGVFVERWGNWSTNFLKALEVWGNTSPQWRFQWIDIYSRNLTPAMPIMEMEERTKLALRRYRAEIGNHLFFTPVRDELLIRPPEVKPNGRLAGLAVDEVDLDANSVLWYVVTHWPELAQLAKARRTPLKIICLGGFANPALKEVYLIEIGDGYRCISVVGQEMEVNYTSGVMRLIATNTPSVV